MMKRRRTSLDCIRILAMLFIIIFHWNYFCVAQQITTPNILFLTFANGNMGNIGVSLFFILSGASLMYTYREKIPLKSYYKKRFLSIYPLYWVSYAVLFLYIYGIRHVPMIYSKKLLIFSFLGMDGFLNYKIPMYYIVGEWFVGCIVLIYLIFPLIHRWIIKAPAVTATVTLCLYLLFIHFYPFEMDIAHFPLSRIPEVMFGMYFVKYYDCFGEKKPSFARSLVILAVSGISLLIAFFVPIKGITAPYVDIWLGISSFLFLYILVQPVERFENRAVRLIFLLSKYSYGIFLVHHIMIGEFLSRYTGMTLNGGKNYSLFCMYFISICVLSVVLGWISKMFVRMTTRIYQKYTT